MTSGTLGYPWESCLPGYSRNVVTGGCTPPERFAGNARLYELSKAACVGTEGPDASTAYMSGQTGTFREGNGAAPWLIVTLVPGTTLDPGVELSCICPFECWTGYACDCPANGQPKPVAIATTGVPDGSSLTTTTPPTSTETPPPTVSPTPWFQDMTTRVAIAASVGFLAVAGLGYATFRKGGFASRLSNPTIPVTRHRGRETFESGTVTFGPKKAVVGGKTIHAGDVLLLDATSPIEQIVFGFGKDGVRFVIMDRDAPRGRKPRPSVTMSWEQVERFAREGLFRRGPKKSRKKAWTLSSPPTLPCLG